MAGPIDADDQSESTVPSRLHARDGVFDDDSSQWLDVQSPGRFEKTIRGRLACKVEPFAFDAVHPSFKGIREAGLSQHGRRVLAG